ncbi:MAG: outer membrane beta-barrel protein [Pseudomonadota bacterium]|nr:outer membrane beta-barrel protein [Pseudomonadota bacterium]
MKKSLLILAGLLAAVSANAGEYRPYVGLDYVNMTPNLLGKYEDIHADNFDMGSLTAGIKFVDYGSIELFAERSLQEKKVYADNVSRSRFYGYGADVLLDVYNGADATILGSVGYGRISSKLKHNGRTDKDTANALRLGVGGEINPMPEWGVRAMYRYSLADGDSYSNSKEFSVGVRYYF